ncbi:hypothetical protein [Streptomyces sp. TP-A0874]|uniref:hypothetical protein n=1 Tax=Streptomyces sp. TP-A0874 TaxID=549819 RepID=UPI0008535FE5|nr:hypothetical protein [Streptomyces sp. TP-A0874]
MPLPHPFDMAAFLELLSRQRQRPIELMPFTDRTESPCGLLVSTERVDYILYSADTTPLHQQHILLHEVAHLLCAHRDPGRGEFTGVVLPNLDSALVRRVLGRTVYTDPQEQEAELVASLILARIVREDRAPVPAGECRPGLWSLFTLGRGRRADHG